MAQYDSFFCGVCKQRTLEREKQKIILYNMRSDVFETNDVCNGCFVKIRGVLSVRMLSETQQTTLKDTFGIKIHD